MMLSCSAFVRIFILTICVIHSANSFNFSPKPNYIFKKQVIPPDEESSYFGYSINLRESSIIVGAPRQSKTGAVFKCILNDASRECSYYPIQIAKNRYIDDDGQWLGATVDGGFKDSDKLVVCAPRLEKNGNCHLLQNTLSDHPKVASVDSLLRSGRNQPFVYGAIGISVHFTSNKDTILLGVPNAYREAGSVIIWDAKPKKSAKIAYTDKVYTPTDFKYFGFSVSSGNFNTNLEDDVQYIASAPHACSDYGEVIIFGLNTISSTFGSSETKIFHRFNGTEYGAFFGYAVLVEDLNNDGLSDIIVTAPMYSPGNITDQGAAFVYISKGEFVIELQQTIVSPINNASRFGTTISKLGDINGDGYNDVAIGAPMAGDGAVFIYLGSPNGLSLVPSQKLTAPPHKQKWGSPLFGHGLSNGYDIDDNGYNDFVVGAPNAEHVYVFQAYPVVRIHLELENLNRKIKENQNTLEFSICFKFSTSSKKIKEQNITIDFDIDPTLKRVTWEGTKSGKLSLQKTVTQQTYCHEMSASLNVVSIQPIELGVSYDLMDKVPNSEDFCESCAALDPKDTNQITEMFTFAFNVDLKVKTLEVDGSFIIGSRNTINITYEITNSGSKAFGPKITLSSSNKMPFAKIPPSCIQIEEYLLCELNYGRPFDERRKINFTISYDVSKINGTSVVLSASASSSGDEIFPDDNLSSDRIMLFEAFELTGNVESNSKEESIADIEKFENFYEVKNIGPGLAQELLIVLEIPTAYTSTGNPIILIDEIEVVHNMQNLTYEFQDNSSNIVSSYDKHLRKIFFQCDSSGTTICTTVTVKVHNFLPNDEVLISLKYEPLMEEINKLLTNGKSHFVIETRLRTFNVNLAKIKVLEKIFYNSIWKKLGDSVPTIVIIMSASAGILIVLLISLCMYKLGFFKRTLDEMGVILVDDEKFPSKTNAPSVLG